MQVPGPFEYERATSVDHAVGLLERLGDEALLVAGGHSLLPMMKLRIANPEYLIDINDLARELGYIVTDPTLVRLGAMTRHREVLDSDPLAAVCPIFRDAEQVIADPVVRNRGTVGGSLCQADPAEDLTTVCEVLDAVCLVRGPAGEREIAIDDFHGGPYETVVGAQRDAHRDADSGAAQQVQRLRQGRAPGRGLGGDRGGCRRSRSTARRIADARVGLTAVYPDRAALAAGVGRAGRQARRRGDLRRGGPGRGAGLRTGRRHARQRGVQATPGRRTDQPHAAHRRRAGAQRPMPQGN